jgi:copper ion binding protein
MKTIEYNVPAIRCKHCVATIKREVAELQGIGSVEASLENKNVQISFEAPATEQSIEKLMEELGYPVKK